MPFQCSTVTANLRYDVVTRCWAAWAEASNCAGRKKIMIKEPGDVSGREMMVKIIDLASTDGLSEEALHEMVEALEKIVEAYKQKET